LLNEISIYYGEIYEKRIDSSRDDGTQLDELKNDIASVYSKGKITELQFRLLNEKISDLKKIQES
jgi:hypothetical protein